jgi:hypothetical protein
MAGPALQRRRPSARALPQVLAVCLVLLAGSCSGTGGSVGTQSARPQRAEVAYRVTGNAPRVVIMYGNKHHGRRIEVGLPWTHVGSAFEGTTVLLEANQPRSSYGYRVACALSVTLAGHDAVVSRDSSHIVGIKAEGGSQKVLYDGTCLTSQVLSRTGL